MRLIHAHDKATPFFMYFALHNTHSPFQAPHRFQALYEHQSSWPLEQTFNAMVSVVDESVGNVTKALKSTGMWDNSVVVWMTDKCVAKPSLPSCCMTCAGGAIVALRFRPAVRTSL